jgi:hypothetical protein
MTNTIPTFDYKLPEAVKSITLSDGYYVKINRYYTATVRNLNDFVQYLKNTGDVDMEVFGQIVRRAEKPSPLFTGHLYGIIAQIKGYESFNGCEHQFVECQSKNETISIRTASGKNLTVCIMEDSGCIDVKYHDGDRFNIIGFAEGSTPVKRSEVSLLAILTK